MAANLHLVFISLIFVLACSRSVFSTTAFPYDQDEGRSGICFLDKMSKTFYQSTFIPKCSSLTSYHNEQTDGRLTWCSSSDGQFIPYTLGKSAGFPYDCEKTLKCPGKLVYETTGRCERTCSDAYEPTDATLYTFFCRNLCICPRETYKNSKGECVTFDECQPEIFSCPKPKVFAACASRCPATCETPKPKKCHLECNENLHCVCPENMVQINVKNRTCVKQSKCPKCKGGAVYSPCASSCPETCPTTVDNECKPGNDCKPGCICPPGLVQLSSDQEVTCVERHKCPRRCPAPKVYRQCASICPATCDNPNPKTCSKKCLKDVHCICPRDYVQVDEYNTTCVKLNECKPKCEASKVYAKCASFCPPTCDDPHPNACIRACNIRVSCVCPPGMVQPDEDTLSCIYPSECPEKCEAPKVFKRCPTNCPPTCDEPSSPQHCNRACARDKCVCPPGLLFVSLDDRRCIKKSECIVRCKAPKVYKGCPTTCPRTCENPKPDTCSQKCETDKCVCPVGMVFLSLENKKCVREDECPRDKEDLCTKPKIFARCATHCPPTCDNPKPKHCSRACNSKVKCVCPPGMLQPDADTRICIYPMECPKKCQYPLALAPCATKCPPTCEDPAPTCRSDCQKDVKCQCSKGFLQLSSRNKKCVLPSECPNLKENCPSPKKPTRCASSCPPTCANRSSKDCPKPCNPDVTCECPKGMVQKSWLDDTCVWPIQCKELIP